MNKQDFLSTVRKARNAGAMVITLEIVGSTIYLVSKDSFAENIKLYHGKNSETEYKKLYKWLFDWHMSHQIYSIPFTPKELETIKNAGSLSTDKFQFNFIHTRYEIDDMDDLIEYLTDMKELRSLGIVSNSIHCNHNMKPGLHDVTFSNGELLSCDRRIEFINIQYYPNPRIIEINAIDPMNSYHIIKQIQNEQLNLVKCSYCGEVHSVQTTFCKKCILSRVKYGNTDNMTLTNILTGISTNQADLSEDEQKQVQAEIQAVRDQLKETRKIEVLNDLKNSINELQIQEKIITDFTESEFYQSAEDLQYYYHNNKVQVTKDSNLALYCESVGIDYNIIKK